MADKLYNIVFGGIGGQGVLKASEICGQAAMKAGYSVTKSEIHGMSQRGGSVESYVRFGGQVFSPLIPLGKADYLVCFDADEQPRLIDFLKRDGLDLTSYLDKAKSEITNPKHLNTYMVGLLSSNLPIDEKCWMEALEDVFPEKILAENKEVFLKGRNAGQR